MNFDQRNGILFAQPKSYEDEGDYVIYGRIASYIPETAFANISGVDSKQLYASLVRLNYIDKGGFLTEEFIGDLKWLDDQNKKYEN